LAGRPGRWGSARPDLAALLRGQVLFAGLDYSCLEKLATRERLREFDAERIVDLGVSKNQLSMAVGTVPEVLSGAFQQLARTGA
jgi:hypothetical protein